MRHSAFTGLMRLHPIHPTPSALIVAACASSQEAAQTVEATIALYGRHGFVEPWIGFLAEEDGRIVGGCGFAAPAAGGEAEIAYFTFPGNEGRGIATRMASALIESAKDAAVDVVFTAHTLAEENASTRILGKLGFRCLGVVMHPEDGAVWKWRLGHGAHEH
jgi:ribosomal-protein-alanine N-acetyltransferase